MPATRRASLRGLRSSAEPRPRFVASAPAEPLPGVSLKVAPHPKAACSNQLAEGGVSATRIPDRAVLESPARGTLEPRVHATLVANSVGGVQSGTMDGAAAVEVHPGGATVRSQLGRPNALPDVVRGKLEPCPARQAEHPACL